MKKPHFTLNAGTGMAFGVVAGALIAVLVSIVTGDNSVWSWAIPVGMATGLAVGVGRSHGAS